MRALLLAGWLQGLATAHATTFVVTTTDDSGGGSLRQAILDANVGTDPDVIEFSIGNGVQTIEPASPLPAVTNPVTIDGTTQPGFTNAPLIEIAGTLVPAGSSGLVLMNHTGSTIRGLAINRFAVDLQSGGNGILLSGGGGHTIAGNHLGTDPTGTIARSNGRSGVACDGCTECVIGGTTAADRNLLSGNVGEGIFVRDGTKNVIQGNWIGLSASGEGALENGDGIFMLTGGSGSENNLIGGEVPGAANVISGNGNGIVIGNSTTSGNVVQRNLIGTDPTGAVLIGNGIDAILLDGAPSTIIDGNVIAGSAGAGISIRNAAADGTIIRNNAIGVDASGNVAMPNGTGIVVTYGASGAPLGASIGDAGQGNVIAHNLGDGIAVVSGFASNPMTFVSPSGVDVRDNRIFANGGLGIDLEDDGVTDNDAGDGDDGANGLQNFPIVTGVTDMGDMTEVTGTLDAAIDTQYRIELFGSAAADPSGNGEAETPLGTVNVLTDGAGHADIVALLAVTVSPGMVVTATATDPARDTSELSPAFAVTAPTTTSSSTSTSTSSTSSSSTTSSTSTTEEPTTTSTSSTSSSTTTTTTSSTSTTSSPTTSSTVEPTTTTSSTAEPTTTTSSTVQPTTTTTSTVQDTTTTSSTVAPSSTTTSTIVATSSTTTTVVPGSTTSSTTTTAVPTSTSPSSSSSTTTTPGLTTTSTTLAACERVPTKNPFEMVGCRIDVLEARVAGEVTLGPVQASLSTRLNAAAASLDEARAACEAGTTKRMKKGLAKVARSLAQVRKTLRSRKARDVAELLRADLTTTANGIRGDVLLMKTGLICS